MYSQQSQQPPNMSRGDVINLLYRILGVLATCITPFMRTGFGVEAPGMNGVLATLLMIVVCASVPDMHGYFFLWFFALLMRRAQTLRNVHRGVITHSRYEGYPWLAMKVPFIRRESTAKLIAEPLVCLGLAGLLYLGSPPFGLFMMICAAALFLKCLIEHGITYLRIQRMRDAEIEQRWYSQQFRKGGR
jgi:hypothetical protein